MDDALPQPRDPMGIIAGSGLTTASWNSVLRSINVPSLLVAISYRMGPELRKHSEVEDVWQETLLRGWRDRAGFTWQGVTAFRHWLLHISEHVIGDMVDARLAAKRGGGRVPASLGRPSDGGGDSTDSYAGPVASTTPSRAASDREQAARLESVLESLPDDYRTIVRLRVFEGLLIEEVAEKAGVGVSAARHRLRKALEMFRLRLRSAVRSSSGP